MIKYICLLSLYLDNRLAGNNFCLVTVFSIVFLSIAMWFLDSECVCKDVWGQSSDLTHLAPCPRVAQHLKKWCNFVMPLDSAEIPWLVCLRTFFNILWESSPQAASLHIWESVDIYKISSPHLLSSVLLPGNGGLITSHPRIFSFCSPPFSTFATCGFSPFVYLVALGKFLNLTFSSILFGCWQRNTHDLTFTSHHNLKLHWIMFIIISKRRKNRWEGWSALWVKKVPLMEDGVEDKMVQPKKEIQHART